jgi:hypothetical protein
VPRIQAGLAFLKRCHAGDTSCGLSLPDEHCHDITGSAHHCRCLFLDVTDLCVVKINTIDCCAQAVQPAVGTNLPTPSKRLGRFVVRTYSYLRALQTTACWLVFKVLLVEMCDAHSGDATLWRRLCASNTSTQRSLAVAWLNTAQSHSSTQILPPLGISACQR